MLTLGKIIELRHKSWNLVTTLILLPKKEMAILIVTFTKNAILARKNTKSVEPGQSNWCMG